MFPGDDGIFLFPFFLLLCEPDDRCQYSTSVVFPSNDCCSRESCVFSKFRARALFYCLAESTSSVLLLSITGPAEHSFVFLSSAILSVLDSLVFVNLIIEIPLKLIGTGHT